MKEALLLCKAECRGLDIYKKPADDAADLPNQAVPYMGLAIANRGRWYFFDHFSKDRAAKELWKQQKIRLSGEKRNGKRREIPWN